MARLKRLSGERDPIFPSDARRNEPCPCLTRSLPQPCSCSGPGSLERQCDARTGRCVCRHGYEGDRCHECSYGSYGYPHCRPCGCDPAGTDPRMCRGEGHCQCDGDGRCPCKVGHGAGRVFFGSTAGYWCASHAPFFPCPRARAAQRQGHHVRPVRQRDVRPLRKQPPRVLPVLLLQEERPLQASRPHLVAGKSHQLIWTHQRPLFRSSGFYDGRSD